MNTFLRQRGMSLISMMIGLLISMLCVLACFTAYKNLVHISADNKVFSAYDGKLALAMNVLEKSVQAAGFGIADAGSDDIRVITNGTTRQLLWRYQDTASGTYLCRGFEETSVAESGENYREMRITDAAGTCSAEGDLAAMTWNVRNIIARWQLGDNELTDYITDNGAVFALSVTEAECLPFGAAIADSSEKHLLLTITAPNAARLFNPAVPELNNQICLSNFYPDAS